jgi:hypothetical protein
MKKKNPAITAVLNFFLPGLGFTYLGSPFFIVAGIAFFALLVVAMVISTASQTTGGTGADIAVTIGIDLVWASISWEVTNLFNAVQPKAATQP